MAKIKEVVKLKSGYANFVELKSAFEAAQENADRMAMYRPTKAHRVAFERICRGVYTSPTTRNSICSAALTAGANPILAGEEKGIDVRMAIDIIRGKYAERGPLHIRVWSCILRKSLAPASPQQ